MSSPRAGSETWRSRSCSGPALAAYQKCCSVNDLAVNVIFDGTCECARSHATVTRASNAVSPRRTMKCSAAWPERTRFEHELS